MVAYSPLTFSPSSSASFSAIPIHLSVQDRHVSVMKVESARVIGFNVRELSYFAVAREWSAIGPLDTTSMSPFGLYVSASGTSQPLHTLLSTTFLLFFSTS